MAKTRTTRPRKAASVISLFTFYLSSKSPSARRKLIHVARASRCVA